MMLARNGIIPPKEWIHHPEIKNTYNRTVAICLALAYIIPPKEW